MTTIKEVAQRAGASVTAVSMALNHREDGHVKKELAEHIRKTARKMGYRPNPLARSLRTSRTHTIGFISEEIATTPYAGGMILGAQDAASELGYMMLLVNTDGNADETSEIAALKRYGVDGYLYAKMYDRISRIPDSLNSEKTVLINANDADKRVPYITPDEVAIGYDATKRLAEAGAKRIAYIGCSDDLIAEPLRFKGYKQALTDSKIPFNPDLVAKVPNDGPALQTVSRLFDEQQPDGFFCFNDARTWYVYQCAAQHGLRIGHDISVIGVDNNRIIKETFEPRPATLELPHYEMGYWGARKLISMIEDRKLDDTAPGEAKTTTQIPSLDAPNPVRIRCKLLEHGSLADTSKN